MSQIPNAALPSDDHGPPGPAVIACEGCGAQYALGELAPGLTASCRRCGGVVLKLPIDSLERSLALTVTGLVLLLIAATMPFMSMGIQGRVQEVDLISDQVVLIANGMIVAEGKIRKVRDEIQEHPSQYIVRCRDRDASGVAALLFAEDHVTEIKLIDDRLGMLVMTRDREQFARALGRIALDGHRIDSVVPADENVDALYEYLIGGQS